MKTYKIIDLFAGVGGIRLGFEQTERVKAVYSNEIDKNSAKTYLSNFGDDPTGDITKVNEKEVPNFDILLAGFPCQAFSMAGKRLGFEDTRGTLFFDVARIIKEKKPSAILLENVKGLISHDKGKTLKVILAALEELNYEVQYKIINAKDFGVPQKRQRIYIVGFNRDKVKNFKNFKFPVESGIDVSISSILEKNVAQKFYLSQQYYTTLIKHKERHANKGNGFGYEVIPNEGIANTIVVGGMGRERNLVVDKSSPINDPKLDKKPRNGDNIRMMTPREWARLQGYPDTFKFPVPDSVAYKQLGNSVAVPVIHAIAKEMIKVLDDSK